jgi:hypothetical protein
MHDDLHVLRLPEPLRGSCERVIDGWWDEVIIDFPSVAGLVDRMQAAFFAEEMAVGVLAAEVEVSPRQACNGGRVPVEIPLRRACPACDGRGEVWDEKCDACCGVGDLIATAAVQVLVPSGVRDGARFRLRLPAPAVPQTFVELLVRVR